MIAVRFEGGAELARNLAQLPARVSASMVREALRDAAGPLAERASELAPRQPGGRVHLADSILVKTARVEGGLPAVAVGPSKGTFYGGFLEFGTMHQAAEPFMRPAFDTEVDGVLEAVRRSLWIALAGRGFHRTATAVTRPTGPGRIL